MTRIEDTTTHSNYHKRRDPNEDLKVLLGISEAHPVLEDISYSYALIHKDARTNAIEALIVLSIVLNLITISN